MKKNRAAGDEGRRLIERLHAVVGTYEAVAAICRVRPRQVYKWRQGVMPRPRCILAMRKALRGRKP